MKELHSFIIPIPQLRRNVEMHTSRIGMYRRDGDSPDLMEKYSLTDGESFLFKDYLNEAVGKTYNWIKAFGRNLPDACKVYPAGELKEINESNGVEVTVNGIRKDLDNIFIHVTDNMYTISEVEVIPPDKDKKHLHVELNIPEIAISIGNATRVDYTIRVNYTTLADGVFQGYGKYEESRYTEEDEVIDDTYTFNVVLKTFAFDLGIKRIDSVEIIINDIVAPSPELEEGDYIKYIKSNGSIVYGIITEAGGLKWKAKWLPGDVRDNIVFTVELPDWQDRNMLDVCQEHLTNALAFYIMYRWFETVQDGMMTMYGSRWHKPEDQSEKFYMKYEEEGYAAKSSLNSQRRILQRKSAWLQ